MKNQPRVFRIVTNGHKFRIEELTISRRGWFFSKEVEDWGPIGAYRICGVTPIWSAHEFDTIDEAQSRINEVEDYDGKLHDWEPVTK